MGLFNFLRRAARGPADNAAMRRYIEVEYGAEIGRATRAGADREAVIRNISNKIGW